MRLPPSARFAVRSLSRNTRRSVLSIAGVAVGCSVALTSIAMTRGKIELFIRNVAEGGVGHFRVVPEGWQVGHDPALRLRDAAAALALVRGTAGVRVATPRARIQAMLAMGTRVAGVEIVGVDPSTEPGTLRYVRTMTAGRYLRPEDSHEMVIGQAIADRLKVEVGDSVVVSAVDRSGAIRNEMLDVAGIVRLGSQALENAICQVNLRDVEELSGLSGVGEIAAVLPSEQQAAQLTFRPAQSIAPQGNYREAIGADFAGEAATPHQILGQQTLLSQYNQIKNRELFLYYFGVLKYDDVFGKTHQTQFCIMLADPATKEVGICDAFNDLN